MINNHIFKETCKNRIANQFKGRSEVEFGKKIPGTDQSFDVICYKRGRMHMLRPREYIVFEIFGSIDIQKVEYFKSKVQNVADKIEMAFMCLSGEEKAGSLPLDKIKRLYENEIPIAIFPC